MSSAEVREALSALAVAEGESEAEWSAVSADAFDGRAAVDQSFYDLGLHAGEVRVTAGHGSDQGRRVYRTRFRAEACVDDGTGFDQLTSNRGRIAGCFLEFRFDEVRREIVQESRPMLSSRAFENEMRSIREQMLQRAYVAIDDRPSGRFEGRFWFVSHVVVSGYWSCALILAGLTTLADGRVERFIGDTI